MAEDAKDQEGTEEYRLTLDRDIIGGQTPGEPQGTVPPTSPVEVPDATAPDRN